MSTGTTANFTEAVKRVPVAPPVTAPTDFTEPGQRFAPRQAKAYKDEDLKQYTVPELTMQNLLSAIPKHCFTRSAWRSGLYLVVDLLQIAALAYAASWITPLSERIHVSTRFVSESTVQSVVRFSLWTLYSIYQGLVFTGVWVVAHECGHRAFSESKTVNDVVGWIFHSALLVPYHSWRISHARHHAGTGHISRDEVFVPRTRDERGQLPMVPASDNTTLEKAVETSTLGERLREFLEDAPLYAFTELLVQQLLGWPLYLSRNVSGQLQYPKGTNHFSPDSIIFDKRHRGEVWVSDLGIALTLSALATWAYLSPGGWWEVTKYYIFPYLWTNNWLVMITYLQHTDPNLPHYDASEWTFPRGALCTIDRNWLGPVGPYLLHGISETHVSHHICSKIPHYHAWEATEAIKKCVGEHYMKSEENVLVSLWKNHRACRFVENEPVAFYRNSDGVPASAAVFSNRENAEAAPS